MEDIKEKTFTEGCEDSSQERDREERYNPNRELSDTDWMKHVKIK